METNEKTEGEQFAVSMCRYIFSKLRVLRCDCGEAIERDGLCTEAIGKTILYFRIFMRGYLNEFFNCNFNRILADVGSIAYEFCSRMYTFSISVSYPEKFFGLSACVIELFLYCRECYISGVGLNRAPRVWKTIFDSVLREEFYGQGGWSRIAEHAHTHCEKLLPYLDPLIEDIKDPLEGGPIIGDAPKALAYTCRELCEALQRSYSTSILSFFPNIPSPIILNKEDMEDIVDEYAGSSSSPPLKRFKRVHQVFDYT